MQNVYPALRITDYEKSKAFYVDGLRYQIEGKRRFAPHHPVFTTITRGCERFIKTLKYKEPT